MGLSCLSEKELEFVCEFCGKDIEDGLRFYNSNVVKILPNEVVKRLEVVKKFDFEIDDTHKEVTDDIIHSLDRLDEEKIVRVHQKVFRLNHLLTPSSKAVLTALPM
ncbi:hypothetical protein [Archaeoglobus profundus]|uniref:Uncharacterized protein n=1 Tax=Archaeoglobus profundus (strain DSM 5631 / JCM 9629 / NBRC 100127 / Av18) TaxID=572546 RepID=D2RGF1_ARCPA|nr:hypothetical protein [Archaeoglobus profundus]ADB57376.1 hypothetical protein Arcpr_0306 [Archaeoglobus profundus DSM 5631]